MQGLTRGEDGRILIGDVIISVDGREIRNHDDLLNALEEHKPGDTVTVKTNRRGTAKSFQVVLSAPQ